MSQGIILTRGEVGKRLVVQMIYCFEDFELDAPKQVLRRAGSEIKVEPQVFDLLHLLVKNHERLVTKDEIIEKIWSGRVISETAVSSRISSARNAVADDGRQQRLIKTVHNKGLRFIEVPVLKNVTAEFTLTSAASPLSKNNPSIIVMPLRTRPNDEMEMFTADALVDEISTLLTGLQGINVIPRYAAGFSLPPGADPMESAAKIGANYVVTGSVRREGDRLRVRAVLTNMLDNKQEWSGKYDSDMEDIFAIEDEVAKGVVGALGGKIAHIEAIRASRSAPENLRAWELTRRALGVALNWTPEVMVESLESCRMALKLDPDYALAHSYYAYFLAWTVAQGWSETPASDREEAERHAERAMRLSRRDAEVLSAIGDTYRVLGNPQRAVQFYEERTSIDADIFMPWPVSLPIMGISYAQFGLVERAHELVSQFEDKFPDDDMGRVWSRVALGYIELCSLNYQRVAELHANPVSEYNAMCRVIALTALGRDKEAATDYNRLKTARQSLSLGHYIEHFKGYHYDSDIGARLSQVLASFKAKVEE
ncbi:MAG: winged helix-turn-helix domain-containing protein [Hellea sp.]